jgi:protein-arginine kinase activator protein McsA
MMICPECHKALCKCPKGATQTLTGRHVCSQCGEEFETFKALFWHNLGCDSLKWRLYLYLKHIEFRLSAQGEAIAVLHCPRCHEDYDLPPHMCKPNQP